jgi:hypothetical protein
MKKIFVLCAFLLACAAPTVSAFADDDSNNGGWNNDGSGNNGGDNNEGGSSTAPGSIDPADDGHSGEEAH